MPCYISGLSHSVPTLIYVIDGSSSSTTCWRQARATWMSMWSGFPFRQPSHKPKQASFSNCLDLTSCFWNDLENEQRTILPHVLIRKTKTQNLCQKPWRSKHRYQSSFIFFLPAFNIFFKKKGQIILTPGWIWAHSGNFYVCFFQMGDPLKQLWKTEKPVMIIQPGVN